MTNRKMESWKDSELKHKYTIFGNNDDHKMWKGMKII